MTTNPTFLKDGADFPKSLDVSQSKSSIASSSISISNLDVSINNSTSQTHLATLTSSSNDSSKKEKWYTILLQIVIPFLIAGLGMVAAGLLLNYVQDWDLYIEVKEIIVLVPALLGLKGNLEMTLASRLSTQVNLKQVYNKKTMKRAVFGNFCLTQLQSIVVGFLASFVACMTEFLLDQQFNPSNLLILVGSSVGTASFASLLLGGIIMFIILISERFKINPDNVATPIASSLGDLVTLAILSYYGTFLFINRKQSWIHVLIISGFLILIPILAYYCHKNEFVKEVLKQGWAPVIVAMLISSAAGVILEFAIKVYPGVAIYQPVVNGVGGNLVAIFASRLSTSLHKTSEEGKWAKWAPKKLYLYPYETFFGKRNPEHRTALILISLIIPGHLIFFFVIYAINSSDSRPTLTAFLVICYIAIAFIQVLILMLLCYLLVHTIWRLKQNPDNICIPLLTATGDLLGVSFLFLCFHLTFMTGNTSLKFYKTTTTATTTESILTTLMTTKIS